MYISKRVLLLLILLTVILLLLYTSLTGRVTSSVPQKDSLEYIRQKHLFPHDPSAPTNYSGAHPGWLQTMSKTVAKRLNFKRDGFFLECGAFDGVFISNSLLLETEYGWTGLLVEADPVSVPKLKFRNRRAWVADVCLSSKRHPMMAEMTGHREVAEVSYIKNAIIGPGERGVKGGYIRSTQVQCYPLATLMDAVGRSELDYLSLDVEGMELDILKTIPFHRIGIRLISVEVRARQDEEIRRFLEPFGYKRIERLMVTADFMHDDLYELQPV